MRQNASPQPQRSQAEKIRIHVVCTQHSLKTEQPELVPIGPSKLQGAHRAHVLGQRFGTTPGRVTFAIVVAIGRLSSIIATMQGAVALLLTVRSHTHPVGESIPGCKRPIQHCPIQLSTALRAYLVDLRRPSNCLLHSKQAII
jgi:hypothetical protein